MSEKFVIVGNPNTGKTTLFNNLTGSREKTANFAGVTVGAKEKTVKIKGVEASFVDLPGVYSLASKGEDEQNAKNYLSEAEGATIVFVCDYKHIERNIQLLNELKQNQNLKIKLLINNYGDRSVNSANNIIKTFGAMVADFAGEKRNIFDYLLSNIFLDESKLNKIINLVGQSAFTKSLWLDKMMLKTPFVIAFGLVTFALVLYLAFGAVGESASNWLSAVINAGGAKVVNFLKSKSLPVLASAFNDIFIFAIGTVFSFIPQLLILSLFFYLLESSGVLPRLAMMLNSALEKIGLNGKSLFPLVMGIGCTTSAVMLTRSNDSEKVREQTAKMLPFVGCFAKLPVFICVASIFARNYNAVIILLVFFISLLWGVNFKKHSNNDYFILELPNLKFPPISKCLKQSVEIIKEYLTRVFAIIMIVSSVIWLMLNINIDFSFGEVIGKESILQFVLEKLEPVFKPIGLNNWKVLLALISGLIAKENILSSLELLGALTKLNLASALSLLIFIMLYSPCLPAVLQARKEFGKAFARKMVLKHTLVAYLSSFVFYTFASTLCIFAGVGFLIVFIVLSKLLVAKSPQKELCKISNNCKKCKFSE